LPRSRRLIAVPVARRISGVRGSKGGSAMVAAVAMVTCVLGKLSRSVLWRAGRQSLRLGRGRLTVRLMSLAAAHAPPSTAFARVHARRRSRSAATARKSGEGPPVLCPGDADDQPLGARAFMQRGSKPAVDPIVCGGER
jgi:hypothetical protein